MPVSSNELLDKILLYTPLIVSFILFVATLFVPLQNERSRKWLSYLGLGIVFGFSLAFLNYFFDAGFLLYFDVFFLPIVLSTLIFHYFYVVSTLQDFELSRKDYCHFIPVIVFGIVLLLLFSTMDNSQLIFYKANRAKHKLLLSMPEYQFIAIFHIVVFRIGFIAQVIFYTLKIYQLAIRQKKKSENMPINRITIDYKWIHSINLVSVIYKIIIITLLIVTYDKQEWRIFINIIITFATVYFVFVNMFQKLTVGRKTVELKLNDGLPQENHIDMIAETIDNVTDANLGQNIGHDNLKKRLAAYFEEAKPYLNPDLKIDDLCIVLNTNRNYLSKAINNKYGMNFFNFINAYRIKRAKELLSDKKYKHYSIQGVAEMSGFKSSSSFYTFFKQIVGVTPSDFRNEK